jgi:hypothetical protein
VHGKKGFTCRLLHVNVPVHQSGVDSTHTGDSPPTSRSLHRSQCTHTHTRHDTQLDQIKIIYDPAHPLPARPSTAVMNERTTARRPFAFAPPTPPLFFPRRTSQTPHQGPGAVRDGSTAPLSSQLVQRPSGRTWAEVWCCQRCPPLSRAHRSIRGQQAPPRPLLRIRRKGTHYRTRRTQSPQQPYCLSPPVSRTPPHQKSKEYLEPYLGGPSHVDPRL